MKHQAAGGGPYVKHQAAGGGPYVKHQAAGVGPYVKHQAAGGNNVLLQNRVVSYYLGNIDLPIH